MSHRKLLGSMTSESRNSNDCSNVAGDKGHCNAHAALLGFAAKNIAIANRGNGCYFTHGQILEVMTKNYCKHDGCPNIQKKECCKRHVKLLGL